MHIQVRERMKNNGRRRACEQREHMSFKYHLFLRCATTHTPSPQFHPGFLLGIIVMEYDGKHK